MAVLNHEHEKGRALVRALAEQAPAYAQGKPGAKEGLLETLRGILELYQNHIWKEDAMVFPMADKVLTAADQAELSKQFDEVEGNGRNHRPYGRSELIMLPSEKASDAINIIRAVKATEITARLNLRIRRSYACTQPTSPLLTGLRPTESSNPLPFTPRFYQTAGRGGERQEILRKSKFIACHGNLRLNSKKDTKSLTGP